jgi:hypothetical protein
MKTRPKDLGTQLETWTVRRSQDWGLIAERLAEGGPVDRGDVRVWTNEEWVGECKNRSNLNIHDAVAKAGMKSGTWRTFVVWKRLVRKSGNTVRTQAGPPIVAMTVDTFLELLKETVE